jgi:hypothetical protein
VLRAGRDHARRQAVGIDLRAHQLVAFVVAGFFAASRAVFVCLKGQCLSRHVDVPMSVHLVMVCSAASAPLPIPAVGGDLQTARHRHHPYTEYWQAVLGGILICS